jgi:hypothetical protein
MTQLRDTLGPAAGNSVHNTYLIFLSPSDARPDGLDWLEQHNSPFDGREKLLRLTPKGTRVVGAVTRAIAALER